MTGDCSSPELSGVDMNCTLDYSNVQDSADILVSIRRMVLTFTPDQLHRNLIS